MKRFFVLACLLPLLMGCSGYYHQKAKTQKKSGQEEMLANLKKLGDKGNRTTPTNSLRIQSIRDTASRVGAQGGLAWRSEQINQALQSHEKYLFQIFNFNRLILDNNILPPVLTEARNTIDIASHDAIRLADRNYEIMAQARFITTPPTWRDYLWMQFPPPETPHTSLLPKNSDEKQLWRKYVEEGFYAGIKQAHVIYLENLARLKRDFEGMIRYKTLLTQNMVSRPFVAKMDMGITGNQNALSINDRVLRITAMPALQTNSQAWQTEMKPNE